MSGKTNFLNGLLYVNIERPQFRKVHRILKAPWMRGGVDKSRQVTTITHDQFIDHVFYSPTVFPNDADEYHAIPNTVLDEVNEGLCIPRRRVQDQPSSVWQLTLISALHPLRTRARSVF